MKKRAQELRDLAAQDLIAGLALEKIKQVWDGLICTHVHASVEKGLKALIVELDGVETTHHSIQDSIREYEHLSDEEFPERFDDVLLLDECGVATRYSFNYSAHLTRREMLQLGSDFHKWVRSQLG